MILPPCPACGATFSVDVWLANHEARLFVIAMAKAPSDITSRIPVYLGMFRRPGGSVGWAQALKILQDLIDLVAPGQVDVKGATRPSPPGMWAKGIDQLISQKGKIDLPLTSHGYLLSIVREMADKEDAARERHRDDRRLWGGDRQTPEQPPASAQPAQATPDDDHEWTDKRCNPVSAMAIRLALALAARQIDQQAHDTVMSALQEIAAMTGDRIPQAGYCSICRYSNNDGLPFIGERVKPFGIVAFQVARARLTEKIDMPTFDRLNAAVETLSKTSMTKPTPEFCLQTCPCRNQAT